MRRVVLSLVSLVCLCGITAPLFRVGAASANVRPLNPKFVQELAPNVEPNSTPFSCSDETYLGVNPTKLQPQTGCVYHSSFGDWVLKNTTLPIYIGPRGGFRLNTTYQFLPNKADGSVIGTYFSSATGSNVLSKFTIADTDLNLFGSWSPSGTSWEYSLKGTQKIQALKYPNSTQIMTSYYQTLGFSENGKWMAVRVSGSQGYGVAVIDSATFTPKVISWDAAFAMKLLYNSDYVHGDNVAVSNDGRFVASAGWVSGKPQLRVYDTTTCSDQSGNYGTAIKNCTYSDVWNGIYPGGLQATGSFNAVFSAAEAPRKISFATDDKIVFESIYDRTSTTAFKVAQYSVANVMSEASIQETMLALGDSYISGEGAYSYVTGTDTSDNKCHQSFASYPYILGSQLFGEGNYHSVACSGATTEDVLNNTKTYQNQLESHIMNERYSDIEISAFLGSHSPGYVNQLRFITQDNPNVVLLSIGGNDVHFADIVTLCVLNSGADSCFSTTSERELLLNYVYSRHTNLTRTYAKILEDNPKRRLYVIGYPQIISTTGSCGANVHFDNTERLFGSLLIDRINATIKNAAESVGAQYVDISHALDGHRLCEDTPDGANGLTAGNDKLILGNESYHPTALGHSLIAYAVSVKTNGLKSTMPAATGMGPLSLDLSDQFITSAKPGVYSKARKLFFAAITPTPYASVTRLMRLSLDAAFADVPPGQNYEVVLFSDEVKVGEGRVSANGTVDTTITVPRLPYGAHTLHIFTTDSAGTPLDIMQVVYVGVNDDDADGDGIPNANDPQPFMNEMGTILGELPVAPPPNEGGGTSTTDTNSPSIQTSPSQNVSKTTSPSGTDIPTTMTPKVIVAVAEVAPSPTVVTGSSSTETLGSGTVLDATTTSDKVTKSEITPEITSPQSPQEFINIWLIITISTLVIVVSFMSLVAKRHSNH